MGTEEEKKSNEQYSKNFTRLPNVLFIAYPDVTKEEKYLYADLRRVYWDMKPRFVSLRELSDATKYSISALSKMLPRLHEAGLIHAEIRREKAKNGREKGNPKYHITIVDIWEVNRMFFSCSPKEQVELAVVPSAQLVHEIEQACSRNTTSSFTKNDKPDTFGELDRAQVERAKDNNKDTSKDTSKDTPKDTLKDTLKEESITDQSQNANSSPNGDSSLIEAMMKRLEAMETSLQEVKKENQSLRSDNQSLQEKLSTKAQQLPTSITQDNQPSTQANKQAASYSQPDTQNELPGTPPPSETPKGRKPSTPKEEKPKVDVKRLQALLDSFIAVSREHFNQTDFTVELGSARSDNYKGALSIINIASTKGVRDVYQDFWDESDKNDPDTHWWRDPKHLTFKAFCRGYATRIASIQFNADNKAQKKSSQPNSVSGYRNYTLNPSSEVGETPVVTPEEHPGPAPRRLQIRRVADLQAALASRNNVATAVAQ